MSKTPQCGHKSSHLSTTSPLTLTWGRVQEVAPPCHAQPCVGMTCGLPCWRSPVEGSKVASSLTAGPHSKKPPLGPVPPTKISTAVNVNIPRLFTTAEIEENADRRPDATPPRSSKKNPKRCPLNEPLQFFFPHDQKTTAHIRPIHHTKNFETTLHIAIVLSKSRRNARKQKPKKHAPILENSITFFCETSTRNDPTNHFYHNPNIAIVSLNARRNARKQIQKKHVPIPKNNITIFYKSSLKTNNPTLYFRTKVNATKAMGELSEPRHNARRQTHIKSIFILENCDTPLRTPSPKTHSTHHCSCIPNTPQTIVPPPPPPHTRWTAKPTPEEPPTPPSEH